MENLYRIHDNILLSLNYNTRTIKPIYKYENNNYIQYLNNDNENDNDEELCSTVWFNKFNLIDKKLNRYWNSSQNLINTNNLIKIDSYEQIECELLLQQGFKWENVFGVLIVLKDSLTNIVYKSRLLINSDFNLNYKNEMINGTFWASSIKFWIPNILLLEQSVSFAVEVIKFDDIHNDNTILIYPNEFESLIPDMPLSDKINVSLKWNESLMLEIEPKSLLDEYTVEQILKWNFSISEINNLNIEHLIKFKSDNDGNYSEIIVSNNVYPTNKITLGLPIIVSNENQLIEVTTYFKINGLIATRYNTIIWNFFETLNSYMSKYISSINENTQLNTVEVIEQVNIENNVIDTIKDLKISKISVPTYIQIITDKNIILAENKNIAFNEIDFQSYIKCYFDDIENSDKNIYVLSEKTIENKIYFDINEISSKMEENNLSNINYKIFRYSDNKLILSGVFTKN